MGSRILKSRFLLGKSDPWDYQALRKVAVREAMVLSRNRGDAEDLAQAVLEKALRLGPDVIASPKAWVKRSVRNAFIDAQRRKQVRARYAEQSAALEPGLVGQARSLLARVDLEKALAQLPPHSTEALLLIIVERWSYREVAEHQGVSEGTIKSRVSRARKQLACWLAHHRELV